jgi:predicted RNA-binding Zn-ribbon protein involved in translation (DUF1610 family)
MNAYKRDFHLNDSQEIIHGDLCPECGGVVRWTESSQHIGLDLECDFCGKIFETKKPQSIVK